MTRPKVVIWGASGHALVVADIFRLNGDYEIVGLLDDVNPGRHGTQLDGLTIIGGGDQLDKLRGEGVSHVLVAIGDCGVRLRLAAVAVGKGFKLAVAVHPRAIVANSVKIGPGSVFAAGAVINSGAHIGANVIVNTAATVDHECNIAEGVHIGPGAHLGGGVTVAEGTWIGIGAILIDRIHVGGNSIVGAGSVVTRDVPANVVFYGTPGKVIRTMVEHKSRKLPTR